LTWWSEKIHPEDKERILAHLHSVLDGGEQFFSDEYRYACGNGSYAYVLDRGYVLRDARGKAVRMIGCMTDITERKRAEEKLQQYAERLQTLSRRLVEVQETERRSIARELHDEIGQALTGLKLSLEMSARLPADAAEAKLTDTQALVNELIAQVRDLSLNLRPTMLDDLGLLPTLLWHFEKYTAQTGVQVSFKHTGLERRRFASNVETAVYRIAQEGLTNVARHAGVSEVEVEIRADQNTLGLQIKDRGVGFDVGAALAGGVSGGLSGMWERAVTLGGQLVVESVPGSGTLLMTRLPLDNHTQNATVRKPSSLSTVS
jgi:signal transduction histidine kinase